MKILSKLFFVIIILLQSCEKKEEKHESISKNEDSIVVKSNQDNVSLIPKNNEKFSIKVKQIDSVEYHSQKEKVNYNQEKIKKITDFQIAKKLLQNRIFFYEDCETQAILKIRFRNGKEKDYSNYYYYFVAYYPTEDILLAEGGHTIDVSFNLKNGNETQTTGNPDYIVVSPNNVFRLNGYYNGQECSSYFIQKKINEEFVKVIPLDEEFQKETKIWLCIIGNSFWQDDMTLFVTEESNYSEIGLNKRYFKIKIIEN
ncbi:hypothetical protein [Flavobacterium okayamense]|uniref:Lipoprotein n=1 Tax=Flavobacterium okayamense TaxID=2830782 RepID=A0ABM7S7N8_9FLAO|nr:hypothetical protein [Flavobacterium okayamense]BCY28943.1 hypothetical protein KK2020170_18110 [Flavobacterium okayamense]